MAKQQALCAQRGADDRPFHGAGFENLYTGSATDTKRRDHDRGATEVCPDVGDRARDLDGGAISPHQPRRGRGARDDELRTWDVTCHERQHSSDEPADCLLIRIVRHQPREENDWFIAMIDPGHKFPEIDAVWYDGHPRHHG